MTHHPFTLLPLSLLILLPLPSHAQPTAALPHASPAVARGQWPLEPRPRIVRGFEPPPKPWLPGHRGVDLAGSPGQAVLSAADGIIQYAGQLAGRGIVVVSHGTTRTTYEPVIASVQVGTAVTAGTQIGRLSASGSHCPPDPCLHWGLLRSTTYLNPLTLVQTVPIRLLPLTPTPPSETHPADPTLPPIPVPTTTDQPAPTPPTDRPATHTGPPKPPSLGPPKPPSLGPPEPTSPRAETGASATGSSSEPRSGGHAGSSTTTQSTVRPSIWGSTAGTAVVCLATLITAIAALLIRRH